MFPNARIMWTAFAKPDGTKWGGRDLCRLAGNAAGDDRPCPVLACEADHDWSSVQSFLRGYGSRMEIDGQCGRHGHVLRIQGITCFGLNPIAHLVVVA